MLRNMILITYKVLLKKMHPYMVNYYVKQALYKTRAEMEQTMGSSESHEKVMKTF